MTRTKITKQKVCPLDSNCWPFKLGKTIFFSNLSKETLINKIQKYERNQKLKTKNGSFPSWICFRKNSDWKLWNRNKIVLRCIHFISALIGWPKIQSEKFLKRVKRCRKSQLKNVIYKDVSLKKKFPFIIIFLYLYK